MAYSVRPSFSINSCSLSCHALYFVSITYFFSAYFCTFAHLYFLCSVVLCNRWPALIGESLSLAACYDYALSVYLLLRVFVWQNKIFSSSFSIQGGDRAYVHARARAAIEILPVHSRAVKGLIVARTHISSRADATAAAAAAAAEVVRSYSALGQQSTTAPSAERRALTVDKRTRPRRTDGRTDGRTAVDLRMSV